MGALPIAEGLGFLKSALDIAKGLKDLTDTTRRNAAIIELQEKILSAREAQSTLLDRISALEEEVASFEKWDAEKKRYELKEFGRGAFAYALKSEAQGSEPTHQICPTCYETRRKSILQIVPGNNARTALGIRAVSRCPVCKTEVPI
jgi:hypothetical protein